jgi:NAD(P)H-dependent FMN reductase
MSAAQSRSLKIAIVIGSTRPGGKAKSVGEWACAIARKREDADFEVLDVADFDLPLLDEPEPAMLLDVGLPFSDQYTREHTRAWSMAVASFDGYVFVTPEYNHGTSGALKNAIDFLYHEWRDKAAGFIGYGYTLGARSIESLRLTMAAVQVATVRPQLGLSLFTDFRDSTEFTPAQRQEQGLNALLDHVIAWSAALRPLREPSAELHATQGRQKNG